MELTMLERIMMFEPIFAAAHVAMLPPPAPRLVRQNANRFGDDETASLSDLSSDEDVSMEFVDSDTE
jgi:hypothetical protein